MLQGVQAVSPQNARRRLRLVIFHDGPRIWRARGLEHDFVIEACTISEAVRMAIRLVEEHTAGDLRPFHTPLTELLPAPERCWSAYMTGTPISLREIGVDLPDNWEICVAVAYRHPVDGESAARQRIHS